MRIVEIVRACVYPLLTRDMLTDSPKWLQNIQSDSGEYPRVFLDHPVRWAFTREGKFAVRSEVYNLTMLFCDKSRPEWTQEQHNEVIETQRLLAEQFIVNLEIHPEFRAMTSEPQMVDLINFYDQNVTGVSLQFGVRLTPEAFCAETPTLPFYRLLENGKYRLLEDNSIRTLETT